MNGKGEANTSVEETTTSKKWEDLRTVVRWRSRVVVEIEKKSERLRKVCRFRKELKGELRSRGVGGKIDLGTKCLVLSEKSSFYMGGLGRNLSTGDLRIHGRF